MNGQSQPDENVQPTSKTIPSSKAPPIDTAPTTQTETVQQLQKTETDIEERMSAFERSTIRWTTAMFVITAATGLFIALQWYEMHSGATDTRTLAESAKKQAENTAAQLEIAKEQVKAAQRSS